MKPNSSTSYSSNQDSSYNNSNNNGDSNGSNRIRVIRLRRRNNVPLGFSIRGGREHGTGIFVSEVRAGSEAHHQGLLVGDQILRINGFNIEHAIHDEVLALLRAKPGVVIKVKSMGMIPVKDTKKDPLTWKIVDPGPSNQESNGKDIEEQCVETRISIPSIGSSGLGCSIVKGPPDVPGIYVQSVKPGGLAEKAGLQVGDRIVEMNGHNFTNLDFPEAVAALKSSKQMTLVLLKCAGSHLFPEEKLKPSLTKQEVKKLSSVEEEETRDERDARMMNGHSDKVKSASELDGLIVLNGNSSCSSSDVSSQQVINSIAIQNKYSRNVKVHATVHSSSSGDDEHGNFNGRHSRESGDGMDFETLNGLKNLPKNKCSWNNGLRDTKTDNLEKKIYCSSSHTNSFSEDESCSSLSSGKETFVSSDANGMHSLSNGSGDKTSITSDEKSELSSISSDDYAGIPKITSRSDNVKPQNEFLKRKQHELLMEEFRAVHKKMFGQGPPKVMKPPKQANGDPQDHMNPYKRRQQIRKDKITPPPPPPDMFDYGSNKENNVPQTDLPTTEAVCDMDDSVVTCRRRQREPPITDSRELDPKPPQTYFEKSELSLKPLVTIGTYCNSQQQNRFLSSTSSQTKKFSSNYEPVESACMSHHEPSNSSSMSSTVPSSTSSEPRSPTSESIVSSDNAFCAGSPQLHRHGYLEKSEPVTDGKTVPNNFQMSLSQFNRCESKAGDKVKKEEKLLLNRFENKACLSGKQNILKIRNQKMEPSNELLAEEAEGRDLQTVILKKNGPLNFTIEGGINSELAGKIKVSEILPGSCITEGGSIDPGDQLLMVDNTRLTGLSLTAANVALRNANSNSNKEMKLVIAKAQKDREPD